MNPSDLLVPVIIAGTAIYGLVKKRHIFDDFIEGALEGFKVIIEIAPTLVAIMLAVGMFRASGALELVSGVLAPIAKLVGIPSEVIPLVLMRPVSGTGSLAIFKNIIDTCGPDSRAGRIASVMQGSTETTFYTIALYFGVTSVKKTRHTLGAALCGDVTGFLASVLAVGLLTAQV